MVEALHLQSEVPDPRLVYLPRLSAGPRSPETYRDRQPRIPLTSKP